MDVKHGLLQVKLDVKFKLLLRYILRMWWPNIISNKDLWKAKGQEIIEIIKR
jgi:hypothetical protein